MKKAVLISLKLAILAGIWFYLFSKYDFGRLRGNFFNMEIGWLLCALAGVAGVYSLAALRWRKVIQAMGDDLSPASALKIFMIGSFFSQFLFTSIGGDAIRVWLAKKENLSLRTSFNSTFFDRYAGLIAIVFFILFCFPIYGRVIANGEALLSLKIGGAIVTGGVVLLFLLDKIPFFSRLAFVQNSFGKLAVDGRKVFLSKRAPAVLGYSLVILALTCLAVFALGRSQGQTLPPVYYFAFVPPVILITVLPISLAGWGVREGAFVVAFGFAGMSGESAIAISLWFGIVLLIGALPGGFLWLFSKERRRRTTDDIYSPSY